MKATQEVLEPHRHRTEAQQVERLAVSVRKMLKNFGHGKCRRLRASIDDAVLIAIAAEKLAAYQRVCSAEDAVECESLLDDLVSQLRVMLEQILAS